MTSGITFYQISRKLYKKKVARQAFIPFMVLALILAVAAALILSQPLQARGA